MKPGQKFCLIFLPVLFGGISLGAAEIDFARDIEPILSENCHDCHGPEKQKGELRLDRLSALLRGGDSGEATVIPEDPAGSFLLKVIRHEEPNLEMPPKGDPLSDSEIALMEKWITEGAKTPESYGPAKEEIVLTHWSFVPVQRPNPATDIDGFIRKKLTGKGLTPSSEADRRTLIRRLFFVMLGLPPTPEQVEAFVGDSSDGAWESLIEEVLSSPHYGERWASHWLDLVRFGETHGFEMNRERPTAWPYRDWVIEAFNSDKPYHEFVREQIAGDALESPVAPGFLVAGPWDQVKGQDPSLRIMQRMNELDDMINTTGTVFLGLTTGCARCHNHKFDPISQRDYYAMQAIFAGVDHGETQMPLAKPTQKRLAAVKTEIDDRKLRLEKFIPVSSGAVVAIDDAEAELLEEKRGHGLQPGGPEPNLSGGSYTWWTRTEDKDNLIYRPNVSGSYRVWLSWGAGHSSHTEDARYVLRRKSGEVEIAKVNQKLLADGTGKVEDKSLWSGLYDAGIHELNPQDTLLVRGGKTGTAITADIVIFQPASAPEAPPNFREAVKAKHNIEKFPDRSARFIRFTIAQTSSGQPCLDELEIFSGDKNIALASLGAKATSSGDFKHPSHKLEHINDGKYGNARSWIAAEKQGWVQIELPTPAVIDRIEWARDREGKYTDRLPINYRIESALEPGKWETLTSSGDRLPAEAKGSTGAGEDYQFTGKDGAQGRQWHEQLIKLVAEKEKLEKSNLIYAGKYSQPGPTHRLYRGEPEMKREEVAPNAIAVFTSLDLEKNAPDQARRLAFANWVADPNNPLTARVIVNRLWQFHFGAGIVDTPSDFGRNGTAPSHPELLDWLAAELIENEWSLKHIHRLILTSATWQQSNRPKESAMKVDAASRLLWRFPSRRLEAEGIRDSILSVAGSIDLETRGGPGFSPFKIEMENVRHYYPKESYGPEDWRRMIYMTKVRQERENVFGAFDCPDASQTVAKRSRSTTPLQALNLLNSPFVIQQAEFFAQRLENEHKDREAQIQRAWELCFGRFPTGVEVSESLAFIETEGIKQFTRALLNMNEFVFIP